MKQVFRAFAHRNYRLYWTGFVLSLTGTWMQMLAQSWLVWRLTESPLWLGIIGAMPHLPSLLLGSIGGVLVDRSAKRTILLVTQTGMGLSALALALLTFTGNIHPWHILILSTVSGIFMAVDTPARLSFVTDLVGKDDLGNAVALNSTTFNAARLIGPSIAGIMVPIVGEGGCFLINAVSFSSLIIALLMMRNLPPPSTTARESIFKQLHEAYLYVTDSPVPRTLILNTVVFAVFGFSYAVLMPVFADEILKVGVRGLGLLMGAGGIGALAGGIWQAWLPKDAKRGRIILISTVGLGVSLMLFSVSRDFYLSSFALAVSGFFGIALLTSTNTTLQIYTPDHLRGRVLGFYSSSFLGFLPLGSFLLGALADVWSASLTLFASAVVCIIVALATILGNKRLKAI